MTVLPALPHRVAVFREADGAWSPVGETVRCLIVQGERQADGFTPSQRFASMFTNASVDISTADRLQVIRGPGSAYRINDLSQAHGPTGVHHLELSLEATT